MSVHLNAAIFQAKKKEARLRLWFELMKTKSTVQSFIIWATSPQQPYKFSEQTQYSCIYGVHWQSWERDVVDALLPLGFELMTTQRDLGNHIERVLRETFLWLVMHWPKMGIVKARKMDVRSKLFLLSKAVQDFGNRSAELCLVTAVMQQLGRLASAGYYLYIWEYYIINA